MKPFDIVCPVCGAWCGKRHMPTLSDPGFCEGPGENFTLVDWRGDVMWYCSEDCMEKARIED